MIGFNPQDNPERGNGGLSSLCTRDGAEGGSLQNWDHKPLHSEGDLSFFCKNRDLKQNKTKPKASCDPYQYLLGALKIKQGELLGWPAGVLVRKPGDSPAGQEGGAALLSELSAHPGTAGRQAGQLVCTGRALLPWPLGERH